MRKVLGIVLFCIAVSLSAQESHEFTYQPPPCQGNVFVDVDCSGQFDAWVEQMAYEGITAGTSTNPPLYSPEEFTKRGQDAVFILKTEHSILNRFGVGQVTCPPPSAPEPAWAKCSSSVFDPAIHSNSVVMLTYRTRGSDDQIPARVKTIFEGGFEFEIQTNQRADYLSYTPGDVQREP